MRKLNKTSAAKVLLESVNLRAEAEALMEEHGITAMLSQAEEMKKAVTEYCTDKNVETLPLEDGRYGKLISAVAERIWVGTKADIPEGAPVGTKPLKSIVSKEVWMKITRRVPDPEKINDAVAEGLITLDELGPSYVEKRRAPYLRVFGEGDGEE